MGANWHSPSVRAVTQTSGFTSSRVQPSRKLTFQDHNTFPIWSSDGKQIIFLSVTRTGGYMFSIPSDGSALQPERVAGGLERDLPLASSPDGAYFLFRRNDDLWLLKIHERSARAWIPTPFNEHAGSFSPDGRWVLYSSNQSARTEVWVRPFPGGAPVQVSSDGGHDPVWSRDGKEIFYENGGNLMSARVLSEVPVFQLAPPQVLFQGGFAHDDTDLAIRFFDAALDGRLLMIEQAGASNPAAIVLLQHWDQELNRLLPAK